VADTSTVRFESHGDVGVVVLDAPPLNLFDDQLTRDLIETLRRVASEPPRALVIRAEGDIFTGGVDVHVFRGKTPAQAAALFDELLEITHLLEDLAIATLASVHGLCLTAGFELALACDMIWASESARFGLVEAVVGLTPGMGGTQRVAERDGPARARELVMTGGLYPAETLERWNVVNRVLGDGDLQDKSMAFAERLASGPTLAHAATKRMVRAFLDEGVRGADARVGDISGGLFGTEDLQGAVESFLDVGPGKASFSGR